MSEVDADLLRACQERIASAPSKINNNTLYAGSPMYFYCEICGGLSDKLPEDYKCLPKKHCEPCVTLRTAHPGISDPMLRDMAIHMRPAGYVEPPHLRRR